MEKSLTRSLSFYSLIIIISACLLMLAGGISRGAFGIFFEPMAGEFGWSSAALSGTFTISMIIEGLVSAFSGWLSDRFGARIVLTCSGIIACAGFILTSQVHSLWQMYLIYGLTLGIGLGGVMVPAVSTLARKFSSRRSLLTGIALAANGIGQLLSPLLAYLLIYNYDWRISYIAFGILMFILIAIPGQFINFTHKNKKSAPEVADLPETGPVNRSVVSYTFGQAIRTWLFWRMLIMFVCFGFSFLLIMVHLAPYASGIGLSAATAANILACFGGAMIVGRLGLGSLGDKIGSKNTAVIGFISLFISFLILLFTREVWTLFLFSILCGVGCGGVNTTQSPISAEYFGVKSHGTIFGTMAGLTVMMAATGPFVAGYLFDITGNYTAAFIVCSFLSVLGLILCLLLKPVNNPEDKL